MNRKVREFDAGFATRGDSSRVIANRHRRGAHCLRHRQNFPASFARTFFRGRRKSLRARKSSALGCVQPGASTFAIFGRPHRPAQTHHEGSAETRLPRAPFRQLPTSCMELAKEGWNLPFALEVELFGWRNFANRRQLGAVLGLTPWPFANRSNHVHLSRSPGHPGYHERLSARGGPIHHEDPTTPRTP